MSQLSQLRGERRVLATTSSRADTLVAWVGAVVAAQPDRPALLEDGRCRTYAEMWARAAGVAHYLLRIARTPPGSRIAIIGRNEVAYIEAYLGILRAGHVAVPLNPMLDLTSVEEQVELVGASGIVVGDVDEELAGGLLSRSHAWTLSGIESQMEAPARALPVPSPDDPACIIPTSGSTGRPKGVVHTQATLLHSALQLVDVLPWNSQDRSLAFLPFFAAIPEQVHPCLCVGASLEILPRFELGRVVDACSRITCFDAVPTLMARLIDAVPTATLAALRWVYFASEPMPTGVLRRWQEMLPDVAAYEFYGMTELLTATIATPRLLLEEPTSVGIPFPTSRVSSDPGTGELHVRSPAQMLGYHNDQAATRASLTPDGAIRTGDLGHVDDQGRVFLTGRLKDLIITGGLNVVPSEIEAVACNHAAVGVAAVVGIPHPRWGETPVVVGVAKLGVTLTPEDLLMHCRSSLKGFKRPTAAAVVEALPSTGIGKIAKSLLRDQIVRGEIALVRAE